MRAPFCPFALGLALSALLGCGARSDIELSAGGAAAPPPDTDADACPGAPDAPTPLATISGMCTGPTALTIANEHLYYGVFVQCGEPNGTGDIRRVPLAGGMPEDVDSGNYDYGPIVHDTTNLYVPKVVTTPGTSWHAGVAALPLVGGAAKILMSPSPQPGPLYVTDLWASDATGAVWLFSTGSPSDPTLLARSDGAGPGLVASIPGWAFELVVAGEQVFVHATHALYSVPLAGGPATELRPLTLDAALLGVTASAVFFTPDGTSIVRREVATGAETTLTTGASIHTAVFANRVASWVDETGVYFGEGEMLKRVGLDGGAPEVLASETGRQVQAITSDGCDVYWGVTASGSAPAEVRVRSKR